MTWFPETWTIAKRLSKLYEDTIDIPFWVRDPVKHDHYFHATRSKHEFSRPLCCLNHYLGLPRKDGIPKPIFDYELKIFDYLEKYNDIIILKARGLGITEFFLRWFIWKALRSREWSGRTGALITGIRQDTATELIRRIRGYFYPFGIMFDSKEDRLIINNVRFIAFPAYNVDSLRSFTDFCFEFADEAGFFPPQSQRILRESVEGYRLKSKPKIIWNSTQGELLDDVMDQIQKEIREGTSPYHLIELPWQVGVGKIYDPALLEAEKKQPYFPREYELKKSFGVGDLFLESTIQKCLDIPYEPTQLVYEAPKIISFDPAYGGASKFASIAAQFVDGRVQIIAADEWERPDPKLMEDHAMKLVRQLHLFEGQTQNGQIIVDGANVAFIKYLKHMLNERIDYEEDDAQTLRRRKVRPINFSSEHKKMLTHMQELISKGYVAIDGRFDHLLNQMRIAKVDNNYGLIKKPFSLDLIDCLRMALYGFEIL